MLKLLRDFLRLAVLPEPLVIEISNLNPLEVPLKLDTFVLKFFVAIPVEVLPDEVAFVVACVAFVVALVVASVVVVVASVVDSVVASVVVASVVDSVVASVVDSVVVTTAVVVVWTVGSVSTGFLPNTELILSRFWSSSRMAINAAMMITSAIMPPTPGSFADLVSFFFLVFLTVSTGEMFGFS